MILRAPGLGQLDWLEHGFGTRAAAADWPPGGGYANLEQIHSDIVVVAAGHQEAGGVLGEGDALVTDRPGVWIGVRTADCAPVVVADPEHKAVAVIHAGWRGTVGAIVFRALERMAAEYGSRPGVLVAAVGPSIGPCCYEVGEEVAQRFAPWWPERGDLHRQTQVDVGETLRRQLQDAGVPAGNVQSIGGCTRCDAVRFHSFRRDAGASGRMVSAARIRP